MTTTEQGSRRHGWGQLSQPVHQRSLHDGPEPWRDNASLRFWDPARRLFGLVHVSTSPNAEGRRAHCAVIVDARKAAVTEPLEHGTFTSRSISFDLAASSITVNTPQLSLAIKMTARNVPADFSLAGVLPALVGDERPQHYQQGVDVRGTVHTETGEARIDGDGVRGRTWGLRDDSLAVPEFATLMACLPEFDLTVIKFKDREGAVWAQGYLLHPDRTEPVYRLDLNREPSGMIDGAVLHTGEGRHLRLTMRSARGGLWVPQPTGGPPPVMSVYDDAVDVQTEDGQTGAGLTEQGVTRLL